MNKTISVRCSTLEHFGIQGQRNSHQNCSSAAAPAAGSTLEAALLPAGNTRPVVVAAAGSNPSAVLAGRGLAVVARTGPEEGIGLAERSWDPEEDSHRPAAGDSSRLVVPGVGECRSQCRQPGEPEAGCTEVDLACRTLWCLVV